VQDAELSLRVLISKVMGALWSRAESTSAKSEPSAGNSAKTVLWLHGLGDTGAGWKGAFRLPGVQFQHPTAPRRPVTCNGGMVGTSWFDLKAIPVMVSEPENPKDMNASVASVHKMLDDLAQSETSADNIILGGFSQGGAVSLLAGLSYPKKLGGIISISGWCVNRADVKSWISEAGRTTPVLMCCGTGDPVVDIGITKTSAELLQDALGPTIQVMYPQRYMHQPNAEELRAVTAFMKKNLSL